MFPLRLSDIVVTANNEFDRAVKFAVLKKVGIPTSQLDSQFKLITIARDKSSKQHKSTFTREFFLPFQKVLRSVTPWSSPFCKMTAE